MEEYTEELIIRINKALRDEISAVMLYQKLAAQAAGIDMYEFSEQLAENGDEEYTHFKEISEFAANHGININLNIDPEAISIPLAATVEENIANIMVLENKAYNDYKALALLARSVQDIETEAFFSEKMQDERRHADSMIKLSRVIPPKPVSFTEFLNMGK